MQKTVRNFGQAFGGTRSSTIKCKVVEGIEREMWGANHVDMMITFASLI